MKKLIVTVLFCVLIFASCQPVSHVTIQNPKAYGLSTDTNAPIEAYGKAAETLTQGILNNAVTAQGAVSNMLKYSDKLFVVCTLTIIIGIIFWGATKSSWGWLIPTAGGIGIVVLIVANTVAPQLAIYAPWIIGILVAGCAALVVWKAIEYHKERDAVSARLLAEKLKTP